MRCPRCSRKLAAGAICPADGASAVIEHAAPHEAPPPILRGWTIDRPIASGGQAAVHRVTSQATGAVAALKVAHGPSAATAIADEARAQRAIGPPLVAAHLAHGVLDDRRPYLLMELVEGETLGTVLERAPGPLAFDDALAWGRGLAAALVALHAAGWIHRDLKPDNIVRERGAETTSSAASPSADERAHDAAGRIRLLDLGLAVQVGGGVAGTGVVAGTLHYMAPEQLRAAAVDVRADVYALGAVLFETLAMRPPYVGDRTAIELGHLAFRAPRLSTLRPVPVALDELLAACLAKSPADRPADAAAVLAALDAIAAAGEAHDVVTTTAAAAPAARTLVALVHVDGAPASMNLDAEVRRRGGLIARQLGTRAVIGFVPEECAAPLAAAIALARAVVAGRGRATVHVADVVVRRSRGRTALYGTAIEKAAAWAAPPGAALLLTGAAARELDESEVIASPIAGFVALRGDDEAAAPADAAAPTLLGRDDVLASARAGAAAALTDGPPAIWIALGGPGSGKTRLADAIGALLAEHEPDAAVIRLDGRRTFGAGGAAATSLLQRLAAIRAPAPAAAAGEPAAPLTVTVRAALDAALERGPVAIVVDDAQWIDDALLAAIATAVRTGDGALWVALCASDVITAARPAWLDAARVTQVGIAALEPDDAATLLRRLLAPARRIPEPLIKRLASRTGGVPGMIAALARELVRAGLVRRHPGSEVWYLAADELDVVPPAPGVHWFVTRRLAALAPGLAELARVCALLGPGFGDAEVDAAARVPAAGVVIDPGIGIAALCGAGLLVRDEGGGTLAYASQAEQEALAPTLPEAARTDVHRAVLAHLLATSPPERPPVDSDRRAALAYHAARAGELELALDQLEALAAASRARLAHLETARWLTLALELAGEAPTARRRRILTERARARRMLTQYEQAVNDLRDARAIAEAAGDAAALVDILVIETACADFTEQLGEAVRAIEQAAALAPPDLPPAIRARLHNWLGVVRARQERLSEARTELEAAIALAERTGEHDTAIGSMLMLGGVLRRLGLVDDGRAVLDGVIELCERTGDHFHLAAAHFNRINVWRRLGEPARAEADAERAIAIANRMGIDQLELWGWYNLSELRWWTGALDGALRAAEHSHRIGVERFRARPPVIGALWYALLLAAAGDVGPARRILDDIRGDEVGHNPWLALIRDAATLVVAGDVGPAWEPLIARAARPGAEEDAVVVSWARARAAHLAGDAATLAAAAAAADAAAAALGRTTPPIGPADPLP